MKIPIYDVSTFFLDGHIENGRFDPFLHRNANGNMSHLKEQKKCYRISIVSEDRGGGAYRATIHPWLLRMRPSLRVSRYALRFWPLPVPIFGIWTIFLPFKIDQIYHFVQILLGPILISARRTPNRFRIQGCAAPGPNPYPILGKAGLQKHTLF